MRNSDRAKEVYTRYATSMNKKFRQARTQMLALSAWERALLPDIRNPVADKVKIREVRRLRISEAARRNGMTYDQFMRAVREWDPMVGNAGFLGDQDPAVLDRFAAAAKHLLVDVAG